MENQNNENLNPLSPGDTNNVQNTAPAPDIKLTPEDQKQFEEIKNSIDVTNSQFMLQYGIGAQSNISGFADNILSQVRGNNSGFVGEVLSDLMVKIKDTDVDGLSPNKGGFMSKIPLFGSLSHSIEKFSAKYQKLSVDIEKIVDQLDKTRMQLLKNLSVLDNLYTKNIEYIHELDLYIYAGEIKLHEIENTILPELKQKAVASNDPMDAQAYNDMTQFANRFDKKIYDLKLSKTVAIQTGPQIRLIQNNDSVLVDKIQSSILNTIPLWKNQIIIAISLYRQNSALEMQKKVTDTTNDLLSKNSELLKQNTIGVAKESERGIVEIETLKKVNNDLISTIEETIKIQTEGKQKRQEAEVELQNIEKELKSKLVNIKNN